MRNDPEVKVRQAFEVSGLQVSSGSPELTAVAAMRASYALAGGFSSSAPQVRSYPSNFPTCRGEPKAAFAAVARYDGAHLRGRGHHPGACLRPQPWVDDGLGAVEARPGLRRNRWSYTGGSFTTPINRAVSQRARVKMAPSGGTTRPRHRRRDVRPTGILVSARNKINLP